MKGFATSVLMAVFLSSLPLPGQPDAPLIVISNQNLPAYQEALAGFREAARTQTPPLSCREQDAFDPRKPSFGGDKPRLIVTLGSALTRSVASALPGTPIVFLMVADPAHSQIQGPHIHGITLDIPYRQHILAMKRMLPERKHIGLIYSPRDNGHNVPSATGAAAGEGLFLHLFPVSSPTDIPALNHLNVDILWIIPDTLVCQPPIIRRFLQEGLQYGIPVIGISPTYVKAGALFALSCDYHDIGAQAAGMVRRVLNPGTKPPSMTEAPRSSILTINKAVAARLGIVLPREVWQEADEVFGQ